MPINGLTVSNFSAVRSSLILFIHSKEKQPPDSVTIQDQNSHMFQLSAGFVVPGNTVVFNQKNGWRCMAGCKLLVVKE